MAEQTPPMPGSKVPCRKCGKPIIWATTTAGNHIPIDAQPDPAGNQAVFKDVTGTVRTAQLRAGDQPEGWQRRGMPHFPATTCTAPPEPPPRPAPTGPDAWVMTFADHERLLAETAAEQAGWAQRPSGRSEQEGQR